MGRRPHFSLILSGFLALSSLPALARGNHTAVRIDKKPTYLPAGPGQKPWNVTRHVIAIKDIQSGGPPRDGIPSLNSPKFISVEQADHLLKPDDMVMGIAADGVAKAYPIRILNWHEVVNDEIVGQPVLVSW